MDTKQDKTKKLKSQFKKANAAPAPVEPVIEEVEVFGTMHMNEHQQFEPVMDEENEVTTVSSPDEDMPVPETKDYTEGLRELQIKFKLEPKFNKMFNNAFLSMPYTTILTNTEGDQIKLIDLIRYVESRPVMTQEELETVVGFIASGPIRNVRDLMLIIENTENQNQLWTLVH